ncbi:hypothetical protein DPMN_176992 [Dreissena polymorpha]|uniref:Uncharacterized protein n=1 Tax=Dreissena polymorpha TaxID=45954 RepID=A0A9D4E7Y2_DREPO|nr:hypothetical protein DPMN_176992 [Dreissena polymorpha]
MIRSGSFDLSVSRWTSHLARARRTHLQRRLRAEKSSAARTMDLRQTKTHCSRQKSLPRTWITVIARTKCGNRTILSTGPSMEMTSSEASLETSSPRMRKKQSLRRTTERAQLRRTGASHVTPFEPDPRPSRRLTERAAQMPTTTSTLTWTSGRNQNRN